MRGIVVVGAAGLIAALMVPGISGASQTQASPQLSVASVGVTDVTSVGVTNVAEVSSDGRFVLGSVPAGGYERTWVVMDRITGTSKTADVCSSSFCLGWDDPFGFVVDNPSLRLSVQDSSAFGWYPDGGVYLRNVGTGSSVRVDTDSRGAPLRPAWTGQRCDDGEQDCNYDTDPVLQISRDSFSADGRKAAFCANYSAPDQPLLYVKDLAGGRLTRTSVRCGVMYDEDIDNTDRKLFFPPEISDDGRIVHVRGDWYSFEGITTGWHADQLYFTTSGRSRKLNGQGTMTRDGGTVFLSKGVHNPHRNKEATPGPQCAYKVSTGRCSRLSWWRKFFGERGTPELASNATTLRGRYLINGSMILDRRSGVVVDVGSLLRERGLDPGELEAVSGDGKVIFADAGSETSEQSIVVTGWGRQPMAVAWVAADAGDTKLKVDIDPDGASRKWAFRVQRQQGDGTWQALNKVYRAKGARQTRTIDLREGTYRVEVAPKGKYRGSLSASVRLYG